MLSSPHSARRLGYIWLWVLLPMLFTLWLSWKWTPDFPHADHWGLESDVILAHTQNNVTWDLLATQKNDSRYVVSRLIYWLLGSLTQWNLQVEAAFCVLMAGGIAVLTWWMIRRTIPGKTGDWIGFFSSLLILWPLQVMNWNFGVQICYFLPVGAAVGTAAVFMTSWSLLRQTTAGIVLAIIASWSFSCGFLVWGLVIWGGLGWLGRARLSLILSSLALTAIGMALNVWFYFSGYQWAPGPGLGEKLTGQTWGVFRYFIDLLGAGFATGLPLGNQQQRIDIMAILAPVMAGLLILWIVCLLAGLGRDLLRRTGSTPAWMWTGLGGWSLLLTALIALARTGNTLSHQFSSRYLAFTLWIWIAALVLTFSLSQPRLRRFLLGSSLAIMLYGWAIGVPVGIRAIQKDGYTMRLLQGALTMAKVAPAPATLRRNDPVLFLILPLAYQLSDKGYIRPPFVSSPRVADAPVVPDPAIEGSITGLELQPQPTVTGYAYDHRRQGPADCIVLSIQPQGGDEIWWTPITSRNSGKQTKELVKKLGLTGEHARIGWILEPETDTTGYQTVQLPTDRDVIIRAYVLDGRTGKFHPLSGEKTIPASTAPGR